MQKPRLVVAVVAALGLGAAIAGCGGGGGGGSSGGQSLCGNSQIDAGENCDDGNSNANDGCSATCQVESGWACYALGTPCVAAGCGDGIVAGSETCDDGNSTASDGCSSTCLIEAQDADGNGWDCSTPGQPCTKTTCGDGIAEGNEQCDDKNDQPFDGCYLCRNTTSCSGTQGCTSVCGDGLKAPDEECDDGNSYDSDGCSGTCKLENIPGITCEEVTEDLPEYVDIPAIFRDFKGYRIQEEETIVPEGHKDFENFHCNPVSLRLVKPILASDGKPVFNDVQTPPEVAPDVPSGCGHDYDTPNDEVMLTGQVEFDQWYRDVESVNFPIVGSIHLTCQHDGRPACQPGDTYEYDSGALGGAGFFPIDGLGFDAGGAGVTYIGGSDDQRHNFHFTTEVHYGFTFQGDEYLEFSGDDDVWIFINGHLAVDLGGLHPEQNGSVTLDSSHATAYGLTPGYIYEMAMFHAERHTDASNFKLTLGGFVKAKTECVSYCGDGIKAPNEECDDNNTRDGDGCSHDCHEEAG